MVVMAYLSGLFTTPAAVLGVLGGMWWWRRYRRSEAEPGLRLTELVPPPPPTPQDRPRVNRISLRSVPVRRAGRRR